MSGFELDRRKKATTALDIAPLIDIVFLLLIFFILSSNFVSDKGFKIKLPKAANADKQDRENITVLIDGKQAIYIGKRKVGLQNLAEELRKALEADEGKNVVIKADKQTDIGFVVEIMDMAKTAKAQGLVISTSIPVPDETE